MNNPYRHPQLKRLRRKSKLRYGMAVLWRLPAYLVWRVSRLVPDTQLRRLRRKLGFLSLPMKNVSGFFRFWIFSRPWQQLLLALPVILVAVWMATTLFLANNLSTDDLYDDYRDSLLQATSRGDYRVADFLSGRLIHVPEYTDDEPLLFAAMIAADKHGNNPRRDLLLARLTRELHSPRAHMWSASHLLSERNASRSRVSMAIQHIKDAIKLSDNPQPMIMQLVSIYYQQGRYEQAIGLLDDLSKDDPKIKVLQARIYLAKEDKEMAMSLAREALQLFDVENPEKDTFLPERLDALSVLAVIGSDSQFVKKELLLLANRLESELLLGGDQDVLRPLLVSIYNELGRIMLSEPDNQRRLEALVYLDKALSSGDVPRKIGALILSASDLDSSGGFTEQQMRTALVRGQGVAMAHLFLGLDAWKRDLMDDAEFHLGLAFAHEPNSLRVVEFVAIRLAQPVNMETLNPFRLSLHKEALWQRALRLLQTASKIDPSAFERNLYSQCLILISRQRWLEIPPLVEPRMDKIPDNEKEKFLSLLIRAFRETDDAQKAAEYAEQLKRRQAAQLAEEAAQ